MINSNQNITCSDFESEKNTQTREIYVLMYVITSEYESSFLSLFLEAKLCMAFDADGPGPTGIYSANS